MDKDYRGAGCWETRTSGSMGGGWKRDALGSSSLHTTRSSLHTITRTPMQDVPSPAPLPDRHDDYTGSAIAAGAEFPELVLTNSHDGTSAYKFFSGVFRLACSNGMVVQSADFGSISVRHSGGTDFQSRVIDATYRVIEDTPRTMARVEALEANRADRPRSGKLRRRGPRNPGRDRRSRPGLDPPVPADPPIARPTSGRRRTSSKRT